MKQQLKVEDTTKVFHLCSKLANYLKNNLLFCTIGFDNMYDCYDINIMKNRNFRVDLTVKHYSIHDAKYKTILIDVLRENNNKPFSFTQKKVDQKYKYRNLLIFKKYGLKLLNVSKKSINDLEGCYGRKLIEKVEKHSL